MWQTFWCSYRAISGNWSFSCSISTVGREYRQITNQRRSVATVTCIVSHFVTLSLCSRRDMSKRTRRSYFTPSACRTSSSRPRRRSPVAPPIYGSMTGSRSTSAAISWHSTVSRTTSSCTTLDVNFLLTVSCYLLSYLLTTLAGSTLFRFSLCCSHR